jgi:plasmid replication initiation protein
LPFIENNDIINHKRCIRQLFKEYKATKRGDNFMNEIVKYHKDFEKKLVLKNFTASELNFLMAICTKVRDKKEDEVIFTFEELKKLSKWVKTDNKSFIKSLQNTNKKLMALIFEMPNEEAEAGGVTQFVLFPTFDIFPASKILKVAVNTKFAYLLNNLSNNFNQYQLQEFASLKSVYSKLLYKELMLFKDTGYRIFKIEDFRKKLDIPEKYRMTNIKQKVLTPIEEDFKHIFSKFEIVKIKNGRDIAQIRFNFTYSNIKPVEVVEDTEKVVNKNIGPAGELEQYFKTTFPDVNYTIGHKEVLEKLLQNNSLEYVKQYLKDQWEYSQNDNNVLNKLAYFSSLILGEKSVLKDYLPADYEEKKAEERNRNQKGVNTLFSLKDLAEKDITDYEVRKNITPEQIEQQVLLKVDVTEEEYNKIKQDWINKQKEETSNSDLKVLEMIFNASQSKKYNVIVPENELNKKLKEMQEVAESLKKLEKEIEKMQKETIKINEETSELKKELKKFTEEDIDPALLVSKSGKKLTGNARQVKIEKILSELNK